MCDISTKAIKVNLHIPTVQVKKTNKAKTRKAASSAGWEDGSGEWSDILLPEWAYAEIRKRLNALRDWNYEITLPWEDGGWRMLPCALYTEYRDHIRHTKAEIEALYKSQIVDKWNDILTWVIEKTKGDFNRDLYFHKDGTFRIPKLDISFKQGTIANPDDIRLQISSEMEEEIRVIEREKVRTTWAESKRALVTKLLKPVRHMAVTLATDKDRFHGTLVTNIVDAIKYSLAQDMDADPVLAEIVNEMNALTAHPAEVLKEDESLRRVITAQAQDLAAKLEGYKF